LDAACGPGNVARYLMSHRPELELLGIDLAPRMVELARAAVPLAQFAVHDCRQLSQLAQRFDGIICAFGLPYLAPAEAASLIQAASDALPPGGVFYLSTILGGGENSGFQRASNGDELYIHYHDVAEVMATLQPHGFTVVTERLLPSPSAANKKTTDLIVIAKKQADTVSSK
jgi:SAM-dependent methyltransferase